ncbi:unnamed protein product [Psylliodes chrysocephalus]|uniref:Uncharacterized protein n=1 Tax=Psylliodes chrysocephalus TaxID=3402493 RepID=A0A9P0GIK2_9CUCU|nr:unnamed protein product [Psylliodes chrysocephala]
MKNNNITKKLRVSSSDSDVTVDLQTDSPNSIYDNDDQTECGEIYITTTSQEDWLQCVSCHRWLHEGCTNEAVEYLYSEEIEAVIVALPPEVDELTDEDDLNDDDLDVPVVSDVAAQTKINLPFVDEDDNNVPLSVFTRQGPST